MPSNRITGQRLDVNGRFGAVVVGVVVGWTVDCLPVFQFVEMLKKQLRLKCIRVVVVQLFALFKAYSLVGAGSSCRGKARSPDHQMRLSGGL